MKPPRSRTHRIVAIGAVIVAWCAWHPAHGSAQAVPAFSHELHAYMDCAACHSSTEGHGTVTVRTLNDCRNCHHSPPVARDCASCHAPADAPTATYPEVRAVRFSVGTVDPRRSMAFPHPAHARLDCGSCHTEGIALGVPADLDCESCHAEHHGPDVDCASCHRPAPVAAHPPSEAHVTCSGSGCHSQVPFEGLPRTRPFCLGCHQDLRDHEPGRRCADCHRMPPPRGDR